MSTNLDNPPTYTELQLFNPKARMNRVHYLVWSLLASLAISLLVILFEHITHNQGIGKKLVFSVIVPLVFAIIGLVIEFIFTIQRCHDFDMSGWLSLLILIPLISFIVFCCIPGSKGENRFGYPMKKNKKLMVMIAIIITSVSIIWESMIVTSMIKQFSTRFEQTTGYNQTNSKFPEDPVWQIYP